MAKDDADNDEGGTKKLVDQKSDDLASIDRSRMIIDIPEEFSHNGFFSFHWVAQLSDPSSWVELITRFAKFLPGQIKYLYFCVYILFIVTFLVVKYFILWYHYVDIIVMVVIVGLTVSLFITREEPVMLNTLFIIMCFVYTARNIFQLIIILYFIRKAYVRSRSNFINFTELEDQEMMEIIREPGDEIETEIQYEITEEEIKRLGERIDKSDVTREMTEDDFDDAYAVTRSGQFDKFESTGV